MRKLALLSVLVLGLGACQKPYQGTLEVMTEAFRVRTAEGRNVILWKGEHPAEVKLDVTKSGEATARIQFDKKTSMQKSFNMYLGKLKDVTPSTAPATKSVFVSDSKNTGHAFDVEIVFEENGKVSEVVKQKESCHGETHNVSPNSVRVVKYNKTTTQNVVTATFVQDTKTLAVYSGEQTETSYEFVSSTKCGVEEGLNN